MHDCEDPNLDIPVLTSDVQCWGFAGCYSSSQLYKDDLRGAPVHLKYRRPSNLARVVKPARWRVSESQQLGFSIQGSVGGRPRRLRLVMLALREHTDRRVHLVCLADGIRERNNCWDIWGLWHPVEQVHACLTQLCWFNRVSIDRRHGSFRECLTTTALNLRQHSTSHGVLIEPKPFARIVTKSQRRPCCGIKSKTVRQDQGSTRPFLARSPN